jgi:hypothetical protein
VRSATASHCILLRDFQALFSPALQTGLTSTGHPPETAILTSSTTIKSTVRTMSTLLSLWDSTLIHNKAPSSASARTHSPSTPSKP